MEFVGRKVKKQFKGFGTFTGTVRSYDAATGYFEIVYEDGDAEDVDLSEITSLFCDGVDGGKFQSSSAAVAAAENELGVTRKAKRRRRFESSNSGNLSSCTGNENNEIEGKLDLNGAGRLDLNVNLNLNEGLDLNSVGIEGLDLNKDGNDYLHVEGKVGKSRKEIIDLNLEVTESQNLVDNFKEEGFSTGRKGHCFDLNLGLDEETKCFLGGEFEGQFLENTCEGTQKAVEKVEEEEGNCGNEVLQGAQSDDAEEKLYNVPVKDGLRDSSLVEIELKGPFDVGGTPIQLDLDSLNVSGSVSKGRRGRKRKMVSDTGYNNVIETVLRRSTRRARRAALSDQDNVLNAIVVSESVNDFSSSPDMSAVSEEKVSEVVGREGLEVERDVLPPKVDLPSSSGNFNLEGMPVLDVFSVYSFLRSFSTLLFLSPFDLEDFVVSVKCSEANLLFDSIHVSLLQTLRKHLECLSEDSCESASNCLRSLDWDLLDLITWPIFMVEYLMLHSSGLKSDFDLSCLKLVESDYYRQLPFVKIEILRCLCDDVIEVEAIKSELNRRTLATDPGVDFDRILRSEITKKRKGVMDVTGGSCVTEEDNGASLDWNSDECCLCKMDGSLICCDGCPAAFHSRCVGVASSLLPDGDWYCPQCVIDKDKPWLKVGRSIRGANLLGIDPYGRLYYSSCGYLLVSDESDNETSYMFYDRSDLPTVIEALKSSETIYQAIITAIFKQWVESSGANGAKCAFDSQHYVTVCSGKQVPAVSTLLSVHSKTPSKATTLSEGRAEDKSMVSVNTECEVAESVNMKSDTVSHTRNVRNLFVSSEGSAEVYQTVTDFCNSEFDFANRSSRSLDNSETPGKLVNAGDSFLLYTQLEKKSVNPTKYGRVSSKLNARTLPQGQLGISYVNYYSLARTASGIAEELTRKSSNKNSEDAVKSVEEIILDQLKAISSQFREFSWPNIPSLNGDARKEKCGWCFSCKATEDERECFFSMIDSGPAVESYTSEAFGIRPRKNQKSHLIDVTCHVLCIEDRLHGLLLGPWLNPQYSKIMRKSVIKASDIASVKCLLLKIESNLRCLALSADWLKHVDSTGTIGSAAHVIRNSLRGPSRSGIGRKRARCPESETSTTSNAASGLSLYWWRGGKLSRRLFNWKVLPSSLASKAARQAGCKKIPGILYPDSSEFAKRSKYVAWRASVESSTSVEQLALQVRELDANIRWDDIENTNLPLKMEKEPKKSVRSFKKVIVRRKCSEGTAVKYLLDFGKRRFLPDIVVKQGSKVEESTSERKKYWLEECHVPLYLLKAFEEKRIARKLKKTSNGKLRECRTVTKQSFRKKGFSYLFSKAERSENYQCGHCSKDVLIRDAVSCQHCEGFFHKRHVMKSAGAVAADRTYTCHKCKDGKHVKVATKKGKPVSNNSEKASKVVVKSVSDNSKKASKVLVKSVSDNSKEASKGLRLSSRLRKKAGEEKQLGQIQKKKKVSVVLPLRRSPRKAKCVSLQNKKIRAHKRRKQSKSTKGATKKQMKNTCKRKRTQSYHSYWLNGLRLSKRPNDEKVLHFKSKELLVLSGDSNAVVDKPRCSLCDELEFSPMVNYIACEICSDWFHGDAFGLKEEHICGLIGFKCHKCRKKNPPLCPHYGTTTIEGAKLVGLDIDTARVECVDEGTSAPAISCETFVGMDIQLNEESEKLSLDGDHVEMLSGSGIFSGSLQTTKLDAEKGLLPTISEQKAETLEDASIEDSLHPDGFTAPNEMTSSAENEVHLNQQPDELTKLVKKEPQLSKSSQEVSEELTSLTYNHVKNGFIKSTAIFHSAVKTALDLPELPPCVSFAPGKSLGGEDET